MTSEPSQPGVPTGEPTRSFGDLTGCQAVVTGASSGIGRAVAIELARGGAQVIVHCRSSVPEAEEVARQCRRFGSPSSVLCADFGAEAERASFADRVFAAAPELAIWVNNAGADLLTGPAAKLDFASKLESLLDVDVRGTILLSRAAGRRMREAGRGVILNIGWDQADRGMEGDSGELFAAAKSAIMAHTRSLALSLAPQVRVNCLAPGWIRTRWGEQAGDAWQQRVLDETPLRRWGTPEDVAKAARFLVSPDAAYLTGQVINVNGGAVR